MLQRKDQISNDRKSARRRLREYIEKKDNKRQTVPQSAPIKSSVANVVKKVPPKPAPRSSSALAFFEKRDAPLGSNGLLFPSVDKIDTLPQYVTPQRHATYHVTYSVPKIKITPPPESHLPSFWFTEERVPAFGGPSYIDETRTAVYPMLDDQNQYHRHVTYLEPEYTPVEPHTSTTYHQIHPQATATFGMDPALASFLQKHNNNSSGSVNSTKDLISLSLRDYTTKHNIRNRPRSKSTGNLQELALTSSKSPEDLDFIRWALTGSMTELPPSFQQTHKSPPINLKKPQRF